MLTATRTCAALIALLIATNHTSYADLSIHMSPVGNIGNAADPFTGYGSVGYHYSIGTYEVTRGQYVTFLNNVAASDPYHLWNAFMGTVEGGITRSGSEGSYTYSTMAGNENKALSSVTFWSAARFTNWLTTGDTETGAYNLGGIAIPDNASISRDTNAWINGAFAIADENEWYKAAYYDPTLNAGAGGYWLYPTQSNDIPSNEVVDPDPGNNANYFESILLKPSNPVFEVGTYENSDSYYGTFDQGGNEREWVEDPYFWYDIQNDAWVNVGRVGRGGGHNDSYQQMESTTRSAHGTYNLALGTFRITQLTSVPEPSTYALIFGALALGITCIRRHLRKV